MAVARWYVDGSTGSDNNAGTSEGSADLSGTGATTTMSDATVDLTADTPDLSGVSAGDAIRLNSRTDGLNSTDIFEITAVETAGADTVEVTPTPDSNTSGVTWAIGGAFATIQRGADVVQGDDTVSVKSTVTYNEAVLVPSRTSDAWVVFRGYDSTVTDDGVVTNDGTTGSLAFGFSTSGHQVTFRNFRLTKFVDGIDGGIYSQLVAINCRCDNNDSKGINFDGSLGTDSVFQCYCHDNGTVGIFVNDLSQVINCFTEANGTYGIQLGKTCHAIGCICKGDATAGIYFTARVGNTVYGCTIDGDGKTTTTGIDMSGVGDFRLRTVVNTVVHDCTTGIKGTANDKVGAVSFNNAVLNCTTAYSNYDTDGGEVTTGPSFEDEANGDYTPSAGSPLEQAGGDVADSPGVPTQRAKNPAIGAVKDRSSPVVSTLSVLGLYSGGNLP